MGIAFIIVSLFMGLSFGSAMASKDKTLIKISLVTSVIWLGLGISLLYL
jgi:hypothetical protein